MVLIIERHKYIIFENKFSLIKLPDIIRELRVNLILVILINYYILDSRNVIMVMLHLQPKISTALKMLI